MSATPKEARLANKLAATPMRRSSAQILIAVSASTG